MFSLLFLLFVEFHIYSVRFSLENLVFSTLRLTIERVKKLSLYIEFSSFTLKSVHIEISIQSPCLEMCVYLCCCWISWLVGWLFGAIRILCAVHFR